MLAVHVFIRVKAEFVSQFVEASKENARQSLQESGVVRFDLIQQMDDPSSFVLVEVYRDADAAQDHKATAHYACWRDTVAEMMAVPRSSIKYTPLYPAEAGWRCS